VTVDYLYNAQVLDVHDGDTLTVSCDLGFNCFARWPVRLVGINARELDMPGGKEARDHLTQLCPVGSRVTVTSVRWDKYGGRILGIVETPQVGSLAGRMVGDGFAVPWNGNGTKPVPPWPIG
jgi:endonuclease YncB( thermonuclease family)